MIASESSEAPPRDPSLGLRRERRRPGRSVRRWPSDRWARACGRGRRRWSRTSRRAGADRHRGPQLVDRLAAFGVVAAGGVGGGGDERGVERAAEALAPRPWWTRNGDARRSRCGGASSGRSTAASGPTRSRTAATRRCAACRPPPPWRGGSTSGRRAARAPAGRGRAGSGSCPSSKSRSPCRTPRPAGAAPRRRLVLGDRPGRRGVAFEVEVLQRHPHAALAVGDRVVDLLTTAPPCRRGGPSTMVNCHSGRVRSKGSSSIRLARSNSSRRVPGLGRAMRRTWRSMSKSGSSTHTGVPKSLGFGCTRQRSRGTSSVAASMRARRSWKSGGRSRMLTVQKVDAR